MPHPATLTGMTTATSARRDGLPENTTFRDDGCPDGTLPSCLACPLSVCRYDAPGGIRAMRNRERDAMIERLRREGLDAGTIAERVGVSRRTIFRVLQQRAA